MNCIEWAGAKSNGYGMKMHNGKPVGAHRLAYCQANGLELSDLCGKVIRHTCDNPGCVNPEHLLIGTQADNMQDKVARGRAKGQGKGEAHAMAKLTQEKVAAIRDMYSSGWKGTELAKLFRISQPTISLIVNNKIW